MSALNRIRSHAERHQELETAAARKRLARGEDPAAVLEALSAALTKKLLHPPLHGFNRAAAVGGGAMLQSLARLYLD